MIGVIDDILNILIDRSMLIILFYHHFTIISPSDFINIKHLNRSIFNYSWSIQNHHINQIDRDRWFFHRSSITSIVIVHFFIDHRSRQSRSMVFSSITDHVDLDRCRSYRSSITSISDFHRSHRLFIDQSHWIDQPTDR